MKKIVQTIQLVKMVEYGIETVVQRNLEEPLCARYAPISEPVTVQFVQVPRHEQVAAEIRAHEAALQEVRAQAQAKIEDIKDRIQKLQALEHLTDDSV